MGGNSHSVRFSFDVPAEVARDRLYVHAQIEVELQELSGRRRRMLLNAQSTSSQMKHFGDNVGIRHGQNNDNKHILIDKHYKPSPNHHHPIYSPPKESVYYISPFVIALCALFGFVLIANIIFMVYTHCSKKHRYTSLKLTDSEFETEGDDEIALVSE